MFLHRKKREKMKIDKQKLIDLLANKAEMDPKAVETQLNQLAARIQDAAEKGKALEIKGFGMFYFSEEGDLKFDPSEELQTEVNYKYAGMKPVEIKKPRESTDTSPPLSGESEPESSEDDPDDILGLKKSESEEGPDKIEPGPGEQQKSEIKPPDKNVEKTEPKEKKPEEAYDPFADFDHGYEKPDEKKGSEDQESKKIEPKPDQPVLDNQLPDLPGDPQTDKLKSVREEVKSKKKTYKKPEKEKRNPVTILAAAIIAVLVIVIGIVIASDAGIFGGSDSAQEMAQDQSQTMAPPAADPEAGAETETESEPEEQQESEEISAEQEQPELTPIEEVETPSFGLHGTAQSIDGRYYSIILHSIRSENRAEEIREELQGQGYRAVITSVNSEEYGTMWRVGIGQFESISNAQDAASELPQNYRDNHFIGLLQ